MEFPRASGVLLHPTSLPGRFGIGDLGPSAYRFVDFLVAGGQQLWQVMPLGPTSYGDSPYQALSALAGNPLLINLEQLLAEQCLAPWDFDGASGFSEQRVDYGAVIPFKQRLLRLSFQNFKANASDKLRAEFAHFAAANRAWLDDFALFAALKEYHAGASWNTWEREIATRQPAAVEHWRVVLAEEIQYHQYAQFQFFRQWSALRSYANQHGIRVIGDIPIFIAYDSADAWAHPDLFYFDEQGQPTLVAGVPPDFFSPTGQRWGNPVYRWDRMAANGYAWWVERFRMALRMVDILRLDHFRGFVAHWAVPAHERTAVHGQWIKGPGIELFQAVDAALGPVSIIAEDLGLITSRVRALREALDCPGMKVLQFAFSDGPDHPYLPHNYSTNYVVYTGTHDNDTTRGWFWNTDAKTRSNVQKYLGRHGDDISWDMIRLALMSVADTAICPLQDVLNLGSESRMNTPGRPTGNWSWRYQEWMLNREVSDRLKGLTAMYGRAPLAPEEVEEEPELDEFAELED